MLFCHRQPTQLHLVPPIVTLMANSPDVDRTTLDSVRALFCAAAPLGKELQKRFLDKTESNFHFIEGMMEVLGGI